MITLNLYLLININENELVLLFVKFLYCVLNELIGFFKILLKCLGLLLVIFKDLYFHILIGQFNALKNYFMKSAHTFVLRELDF